MRVNHAVFYSMVRAELPPLLLSATMFECLNCVSVLTGAMFWMYMSCYVFI